MRKTIITLTLFLFLSAIAFGQNIDKAQITGSGNYYYGTGISRDFNEAKDYALKELTNQIAIRVASSYKQKTSMRPSSVGCLIVRTFLSVAALWVLIIDSTATLRCAYN